MGQPSETSRYRPDIDGLRALAVLGVVLYHAGIAALPGGFTGVDIFFVISGYLIGGHIAGELRSGSFSFVRFYYRRAKRILPASFFVVGLCLALGCTFLSPLELRHFGAEVAATNLFVSNLYFFRGEGYFSPDSATRPLLMTWSLGIEEQFYFVVPVLLALLYRLQRGRQRLSLWIGGLLLLSLLYAALQVRTQPSAAFYLLPSRAWELAAGVLLAVGGSRVRASWAQVCGWVGILFLLLPFLVWKEAWPFPGVGAIPSVLGTVLLIASEPSLVNRKLLAQPVLNYIGRRSYSWYLWHWPLLAFARVIYGDVVPLFSALVVVAVAFALAAATYRYVEQPFRTTAMAPRPLLLRYAAVIVLFVLAGSAAFFSRGWQQRFPVLARQEQAVLGAGNDDDCLVTDGADQPSRRPECNESDTAQNKVLLWGDSHAGAVAGTLREKAHEAGLRFSEATKTACPPLTGVDRWYPRNRAHAGECSRFDRNVLQAIVADPKIRTVVLAAYWPDPFHRPITDGWLEQVGQAASAPPTQAQSDALLEQGLRATVSSLQQAGRQVLVLQDAPAFHTDPVWRLRTSESSLRRAVLFAWRPGFSIDPGSDTPAYPEEDAHVSRLIEQLSRGMTIASTFDVANALCNRAQQCEYRKESELLYRDRQHLAPAGSRTALAQFNFGDAAPEHAGNRVPPSPTVTVMEREP